MKSFAKFFVVPMAALAFMGTAACGGKKPAPVPAPEVVKAPEPDTAAPVEPDTAAPPAPDVAGDAAAPAGDAVADATPTAEVDYLRVVVPHHDPTKPPVTAEFKTYKLVEANIDLTKLETAKAVIEVDVTSVATGNEKRDTHVKSKDFLDIGKFAKATLTVDRLKAVENTPDAYDATATLDLHGVKKEVAVQFKVVEKKADGALVIEGEVKGLARADWGMTAPAEEVNVAPQFDAQVRLTLTNITPAPTPAPK